MVQTMTAGNIAPNLFIVGAPKCGTSSMVYYLSQHPEVFMVRKELHYFGSDLYWTPEFPFGRKQHSLSDYLIHFQHADGFKVRGEKSVYYLHSREAAGEIARFCPGAKIIIMLRNPADFLFSFHAQLLFSGVETYLDLKQALDAEPLRRTGRDLPPGVDIASKLFYRQLADFAPNVRSYIDTFGRDNVLIVLLDDISRDPLGTYARAARFLGIDQSIIPHFRRVNPRKEARSSLVSGLVREPPTVIRQIARVLMPTTAVRNSVGHYVLRKLNARRVSSGRVDPDLKRELIVEFTPRIAALGEVIERDLSHWTESKLPDV